MYSSNKFQRDNFSSRVVNLIIITYSYVHMYLNKTLSDIYYVFLFYSSLFSLQVFTILLLHNDVALYIIFSCITNIFKCGLIYLFIIIR